MIKTVSIHFRPGDGESASMISGILRFLDGLGVKSVLPDIDSIPAQLMKFTRPMDELAGESDLAVVIGGDGTFLRAARLIARSDIPIFGINRGKLGFLTEFSPDEYKPHLASAIAGKYSISERITLEAIHRNGSAETSTIFINDAVLSKGSLARPVRIELFIDGEDLNSYYGDGLIVATPTGSTAYSLSAGGPIVAPSSDMVYLVTPICPHTLGMRPLVVSASSVLKARITSKLENLLLTIDGQEGISIGASDEIIFRLSNTRIRVITHPDKGFYAILREKLGWG